MDTVVFIFRIVFLVLGSLTAIFYLLFQLFQRVPKIGFKFKGIDYVVIALVALLFGFGVNNYWGLLAAVPVLLFKAFCYWWISPKRVTGSGRWVEINWKKLTPKGFEGRVPRAMLDEMNKMPKDTHFIIPRFYFGVALFFIRKKMVGEFDKQKKGVVPFSAQQQNAAVGQLTSLLDNLKNLQTGKTERRDFPFGTLRVSRL